MTARTLRLLREEWTAPLIAERDTARIEALRLRGALEWYADEANYNEDDVPGECVGAATDPETGAFEGEWDPDRGGTARAALSASPVSEAGQYGRNFRAAIADIHKLPPSERSAMSNRAGPSSSSEEGERVSRLAELVERSGELHTNLGPANEIDRELKVWPIYFDDILDGSKSWEIRRNDAQGFGAGRWVRFREWDPDREKYTGRTVDRFVTYVAALDRLPGMDGLVGMTLAPWKAPAPPSLRERLTSDEAVVAWRAAAGILPAWAPTTASDDVIHRRLERFADYLNRTEGR